MSQNSTSNFTTKSISELKDLRFFVNDYQRGYKWKARQVLDLLEDISAFDINQDSFYCLQPLAVVKRENEGDYEVIDGQQRLTTVHIILKVIAQSLYSIKYETRRDSASLLEDINSKQLFGDYFLNINNLEVTKKTITNAVNTEWKKFIGNKPEFDNVDYYHFFQAYLLIKKWFNGDIDKQKDFLNKLKDHTEFIWYEDKSGDDAKKVFRNLNSGKIALTNAELIKALFVNNFSNPDKELMLLQKNAFAAEWDRIERKLQDNTFWYFICNSKPSNYPTRIDYLFEVLNPAQKNSQKDHLRTYRIYASKSKDKRLEQADWEKVKSLFLTLNEWFRSETKDEALGEIHLDNENYHLIGFITSSWSKVKSILSISEVYELYQSSENKIAFKNELKKKIFNKISEEIKKNFKLNTLKPDEISKYIKELDYNEHPKSINRILLLHNIITYQQNKSGYRFPFHHLKSLNWSLEHIHARASDTVSTVGELRKWMDKSTRDYLRTEYKDNGIEEYINNLEKDTDFKKADENSKISQDLNNILEDIENSCPDIDSIDNLALLDKNTNSALGKKSFKEKRLILLQKMAENTAFIPICTQHAFLKVYSKTHDNLDFWTMDNRHNYIDNVILNISSYLNLKHA